jgi:hypothetical protein
MALVIYGSLRHADRDYAKADEAMKQAGSLFPKDAYQTIQDKPKPLFPFIRIGLPRIGGVHIFIIYVSFLLVVLSAVLWWKPPKLLLNTLCPGVGLSVDALGTAY